MADLLLECEYCGTETSISEYVDPEAAVCSKCGELLDVPLKEIVGTDVTSDNEEDEEQTPMATMDRDLLTVDKAVKRRKRKRKRKKRTVWVWSPSMPMVLAMFVGLTGVLTTLRWAPILGPGDLAAFQKAGIACLLVGHFVCVADAFADTVMFGLLSLFVPFYSLVYLYTQCDSFIMRVVMGALVLAFGIDTSLLVYAWACGFIEWLGGSQFLNEGF